MNAQFSYFTFLPLKVKTTPRLSTRTRRRCPLLNLSTTTTRKRHTRVLRSRWRIFIDRLSPWNVCTSSSVTTSTSLSRESTKFSKSFTKSMTRHYCFKPKATNQNNPAQTDPTRVAKQVTKKLQAFLSNLQLVWDSNDFFLSFLEFFGWQEGGLCN